MKHWKDIAFGLFVSLTLAACYGEEDSFATPDIYKDYQPVLKDGNTVAGYAAAPLKEAKYDEVLNELYLTWDGSNSGWEKRDEYVGVEVEFNSLLSGKKIKRVMIPNVGDFGNLTVKRRDYGNEPTTLRLSKYRTVVVTDRYGVEELRFRSIYKDADGARQTSDWTNLSDQADKYELQVDMNYAVWQYFKTSQATQVQISFESDSEIRPVSALYNLIGNGDEAATQEEFRKWYYMDCATMSFEPHNIACDPYENLTFMIKKEQTGGAYAFDYPSHNEGRGIVYPASENNLTSDAWWLLPDMQAVVMHEMGHCVEWMPHKGHYVKKGEDCDKQGYQEGWPDAVKISNGGFFGLATEGQINEYKAAIEKPYKDPQDNKVYVWQIDYNTSGAFMSWLRIYNGDFVRMLPWTVKMDALTNDWSLEYAVKYILKESYPDMSMEDLWNEYVAEVKKFLNNHQ